MIKICVYGIAGKMGMRIADFVAADTELTLLSGLEKEGHPQAGEKISGVEVLTDEAAALKGADCAIDFTLPDGTVAHVKACQAAGVPMVIGTTGFNKDQEKVIQDAARTIPIVFSPNMSVGVNLVFGLVREAARVLGKDYGIKVDETHHVHKKDSPSGTAKMIGRVISEACGKEVPIEAFREGEVIGNHGIVFDSAYETIEIRHDAKTRDVFVAGAIKAAKFIADKQPGLYSMADVLEL